MKKSKASVIIGNIPVNGKDGCYSITEYQEAKTVAVQALEEIQQYRAIGTPEECRAAVKQKSISFLEITASLVIAVREQYFHVEE